MNKKTKSIAVYINQGLILNLFGFGLLSLAI